MNSMVMIRSHYIRMLIDESYKYASLQYTLPPSLSTLLTTIRFEHIPSEFIDLKKDAHHAYLPHITVFHGLSDEDYPLLKGYLEGYGPLHFSISGTPKVFDIPSHNVLVLPIISEDFHRVHKDIRRLTGKEPPIFSDFSPHVTLSYMKKGFPIDRTPFFTTKSGIATVLSFHDKEGIPRPIVLT